jgi:hypothetical protein
VIPLAATGNRLLNCGNQPETRTGISSLGHEVVQKNKTLINGKVMVKKEEYSGYTPELEMT